ncbi:hypothetical protein ACFX1S_034140 [Malus domestica]
MGSSDSSTFLPPKPWLVVRDSPPQPICCLSGEHCMNEQNPNTRKCRRAEISMVSSPTVSNSNISNESFVIRELIGKLGSIGNFNDLSPHSRIQNSYMGRNGNASANISCYNTSLNSPPKLNLLVPNHHLKKEKLANLGNSMALNSSLVEFFAYPGFVERVAKFWCFGSRSFNGKTSQLGTNNNNSTEQPLFKFHPVAGNGGKLPQVSSSPSIKALGSQTSM